MVVRLDEEGNVITEGDQIKIGGNDTYKAVSRSLLENLQNLFSPYPKPQILRF